MFALPRPLSGPLLPWTGGPVGFDGCQESIGYTAPGVATGRRNTRERSGAFVFRCFEGTYGVGPDSWDREIRHPPNAVDRIKREAATSAANPQQRDNGSRKRPKYGKPRGQTCHWTPELDELLKAAWSRGGLRAARRAIRQQQPTWSHSSIKRRAATLGLRNPQARRWSTAEVNRLLMSIDSNASLSLIAERLNRSVAALRRKLWELDYKAASLGGYKVKEVAEMLSVPPRRVQFWVEQKQLLTKGGRITDSSLTTFFRNHHRKIPYQTLPADMRSWLREMGFPARAEEQTLIPMGQH